MTAPKPDVSIVIATYNAESFIEDSLRQIEDIMNATVFNYELIFVDDKSSDQTVSIIRRIMQDKSHWSLTVHRKNHGRGKTVHDGIKKATGDIVGFIDIDLDNPARYIFSMILGIKNGGYDVCTADRNYKWRWGIYFVIRMILSQGYALLSSFLMGTGLKDSETGCKFFKKKAILSVLAETKSRGWFWDTEIMTRAHYHGLKILEIPTLFIRNTRVTTVNLIPDTLRYLASLIRFIPVKNELKNKYEKQQSPSIYTL